MFFSNENAAGYIYESGEYPSQPPASPIEEKWFLAVVVAQLVERMLLTQEIRGSNPDIGKIVSTNCTIRKTKIKGKRPGMDHL